MKNFARRLQSPWVILPLIVFICLGLRLLYLHETVSPNYLEDSDGYYSIANALFTNNFLINFFNPWRVPAYPLFIGLIMWIVQHINAPVGSPAFSQSMNLIVYIQTALGLAEIILLYLSLRTVGIRRCWSYALSLFIGMDVMLIWQERAILTECITTFWLVCLIFFFIRALKTPTWKKFLGLFFIFSLGFLIRPNYVFLPFVLLPIIPICHRKPWITRLTLITVVTYAIVPGFYIYQNSVLHGYLGITHTADINVLGRIVRNNIPIESGKNVTFFYENIRDYRTRKENTETPYIFLDTYDPFIAGNPVRLNEMQLFTKKVFLGAFPQYVGSVIRDLPNSLTQAPDDRLLSPITVKSPGISKFLTGISRFYLTMQYLTFAIFLFIPVTLLSFFRRRTFEFAVLTFLGILSLYQIFVMLFYGYEDWGRLIGAGQPVYYLFSFYWIGHCISKIHTNKRS